jgi:hypothetical protein
VGGVSVLKNALVLFSDPCSRALNPGFVVFWTGFEVYCSCFRVPIGPTTTCSTGWLLTGRWVNKSLTRTLTQKEQSNAEEETLAALELSPDEWHTEKLEAREREATGTNGQRATVIDNVIAVRRLAR